MRAEAATTLATLFTGAIRGAYGLKLADSVIASTAHFTGSTLFTRNLRDFKNSSYARSLALAFTPRLLDRQTTFAKRKEDAEKESLCSARTV